MSQTDLSQDDIAGVSRDDATDVSPDATDVNPDATAGVTPTVIAKNSQGLALWSITSIGVYGACLWYYHSKFVDARYVNHHISNLIVTIPFVILLLYAYWRGYSALKENPNIGLKPVIFSGVLAALIAVCIPNFHSSDVFSYIDIGWLQAHYHLNPYVMTVDQIPNFRTDPMFTCVWAWNPCPYGFAFALLIKIVCDAGGGNLATTAVLLKCINFAAFLLVGALVYFGAKNLRLQRPDLSLYLYLWSPFVLLQSLANVHNDVLMTLFAMTAMFCACTNVVALAVPVMVVSTQIKFLWVVAFPFVLLFVYRKFGLKAVVANILGGAVILGVLAIPYAADLCQFRFDIMRQDLSFNGMSLPALTENIGHGIERLAFHSTSLPWFEGGLFKFIAGLKVALFASFAGLCVWLFRRAVKEGANYSCTAMIRDCLLLALLAVCAVSSKFHPWYILMFFPVALWLPERSELRRLAITLSCTQLFAITYLGHSGGINFVLLTAVPLLLSLYRYRKMQKTI
jgi:hypothetical protein